LALYHLNELVEAGGITQYEALIREALEPPERELPRLRRKLVTVIVESHFLTLKVNFEYFFNRMLYCLWFHQFDALAQRQEKGWLKERVPLREVALSLSRRRGKEFIIDQVVPRHGLDRMADCFRETTGMLVTDRINAINPKYWAQIHSAFEVRHLIEHRKGRVDQRFIHDVASHTLWRNSSWADFALSQQHDNAMADSSTAPDESAGQTRPRLPRTARIEVREKDFEATCEAMVESAAIITSVTRDCRIEEA
jgi:hypothetical protein